MNAQSLARFSRTAARQRAQLFAISVLFRGETIQIPRPTENPSLDLESGGYQQKATYRLRFPASITPPPAAKEVIVEIATGKKYHVATCIPATGDSPNAAEHIVEARLS
jgi:hypothetical protein